MLFIRKTAMLAIVLCLISGLPIHGAAKEYHGLQGTVGNLPADFHVVDSDQCSGHENFLQVSAREDGAFAILTCNTNWNETPELVFKRYYVDIYDPSGNFIQELAFTCGFDTAIEYTEKELIIYFYYNVLTYDLEAKTFQYYALSDGDFSSGRLFSSLRASTFECGDWKYQCKKAFFGYTALTRTNGSQKQILVSYTGTPITVTNTIIRPVIVILFILSVRMLYRRHKAKK